MPIPYIRMRSDMQPPTRTALALVIAFAVLTRIALTLPGHTKSAQADADIFQEITAAIPRAEPAPTSG